MHHANMMLDRMELPHPAILYLQQSSRRQTSSPKPRLSRQLSATPQQPKYDDNSSESDRYRGLWSAVLNRLLEDAGMIGPSYNLDIKKNLRILRKPGKEEGQVIEYRIPNGRYNDFASAVTFVTKNSRHLRSMCEFAGIDSSFFIARCKKMAEEKGYLNFIANVTVISKTDMDRIRKDKINNDALKGDPEKLARRNRARIETERRLAEWENLLNKMSDPKISAAINQLYVDAKAAEKSRPKHYMVILLLLKFVDGGLDADHIIRAYQAAGLKPPTKDNIHASFHVLMKKDLVVKIRKGTYKYSPEKAVLKQSKKVTRYAHTMSNKNRLNRLRVGRSNIFPA